MKLVKLLLCGIFIAEQAIFPIGNLNAGPLDDMNGSPIIEDEESTTSSSAAMPKAAVPGTPVQIGGKSQKDTPLYEGKEASDPLNRMVGPIRLTNTRLAQILDVITAQSGVNFMLADNVENKSTTIFMKKSTVRDALELILKMKGLTYQRVGNSNYQYIVTKPALQQPNLVTKIYTLNYIPLMKDVAASGSNENVKTGANGSEPGSLATPIPVSGGDNSSTDTDIPAIIPVLRSVLSREWGKVQTDVRLNALIVTDVPETFPQVEQIISELDKKAPQILIEAQIVEINTSRKNELGIEWGGDKGEMVYFQGGAHTTDALLRPGFFSNSQWKKFFGSYSGSGDPAAPQGMSFNFDEHGMMLGVFSIQQLKAQFRAMISRGEGRYLGKPKIIAMNNHKATMKTFENPAIGPGEQTENSSGSITTGAADRATDAGLDDGTGILMEVTPQVNKDGFITLDISAKYGTVTQSSLSTEVYNPLQRSAETLVRVKNGQTVVLGGLLTSTETKSVRKVPLLGYIPIVGWLFTSVSSSRENTDLVIFVTPTILVD